MSGLRRSQCAEEATGSAQNSVEAICMPEDEGDHHKDKMAGRAATGQVTEGC